VGVRGALHRGLDARVNLIRLATWQYSFVSKSNSIETQQKATAAMGCNAYFV
jgi:hypothetical protein